MDERTAASARRGTALRAVTGGGVPSLGWLSFVAGLAVAGAAAALVWMTQGSYGGSAPAREMVADMEDTAAWLAWVLVLAVQTAVWVALVPAMVLAIRESTAPPRDRRAPYVLILLLLFAGPIIAGDLFPRSHPVQEALEWRMTVLTIAGVLVGWLAVIAIRRTHHEIRKLDDDAESPQQGDLGPLASRYLALRGRLHFLGGALAVIVALAVLATGGQRNAILAMEAARATAATSAATLLAEKDPSTGETVVPADLPEDVEDVVAESCARPESTTASGSGEFASSPTPDRIACLTAAAKATARAARYGIEAVWSFGLYYTFALMVAYLPSYLSLAAVGRSIRDRRYPRPTPDDASYDAVTKLRKEVTEILQLDKSPLESLKAATLVLIPLITSLGSSLLGGVKVGG